jgi:hypothetical protein
VALMLDTDGARRLAAGAPLITDDDNRIATSSLYELGRGMNGDSSGRALAPYDPLQRADSFVYTELRRQLSFPYLVRRNGIFLLLDPSLADRAGRVAQILGASAEGEYARAFYYRMQRQTRRSAELLRLAIDQYPQDLPLRQEFLRSHLSAMARGEAPPEITEVAAGLNGPPAALLAAARHAANSNWREVALADDELAEIPWRDTWYPEALELRVNWRTRVSTDQARRYAGEAIPMIDRLSIMNPTLELHALRARAGFATQRADIVVESVASYTQLAAGMARSGVIGQENLRRDATALEAMLADAERLPGADAARIAEVRAKVAALVPAS